LAKSKKISSSRMILKNIVKLSINEELNEEENQNLIAQF
jgi:hypothetical protein